MESFQGRSLHSDDAGAFAGSHAPRSRTWMAGLATLLAAACAASTAGRPFQVVSGLVSHNLCSEVFVSKLSPERAYAESIASRPGMGLVDWAIRYEVDAEQRSVTTTVGGAFASRAIVRDGLGCLVLQGAEPDRVDLVAATTGAMLLPEVAGPTIVEPDDARLRGALDRAFAEPDAGPPLRTRAIVVVHDDRVIAERYAPGIAVDTPLLGYSATKSVISALVGILVRQGRLAIDRPAPVETWSDPNDPRHAITTDHLLRMTSGLALAESGSPYSPVARMLYAERDMARYAESVALDDPPGTQWRYTSGNTLIVSQVVREAVGGKAEDVIRFVRHELFDPLGMRSAVLELDAAGTPLGSTYLLASARDWARFGQLYLHDGVAGEQRILPEGWVQLSTTPTLDTGYGAGFWTNRVQGNIPWSSVPWAIPGAPADSFAARGLGGQYVVVVPSRHLVVVRLGASHEDGSMESLSRLLADVMIVLDDSAKAGTMDSGPRSSATSRALSALR